MSQLIIQLRGTSGSGKTYAMRNVLRLLQPLEKVRVEGRRNPLYYRAYNRKVSVLGSYENVCGGTDTIHGYPLLLETLKGRLDAGDTVLMEGLLLSEDVKQTLTMPPALLRVIFLTTPIDKCLAQIVKRRAELGNDKPLNPTNTVNRVETIKRARTRLEAAGVVCRSAAADQVPRLVMSWLNGG